VDDVLLEAARSNPKYPILVLRDHTYFGGEVRVT